MGLRAETPGPFAESTGGSDSVDVDAILSQVESGQETNVSDAPVETAQPAGTPEAAPATAAQELEFNWKGQTIKAPFSDSRVKQWASMGYDYAQRMQEHATQQAAQQAEYAQKLAAIQQAESKYKPVDEFFSKNPQLWDQITQTYQTAQTGLDPNHPLAAEIRTLREQFADVQKFKQSVETERLQAQQAQEDSALDAEIKSIREEFADLDWKLSDTGKSQLELQVLEHAQKNGIKSFKAAFRDMNHDALIQRAAAKALENSVKERQAATKQGLPVPARPGQAPKAAPRAVNLERPSTHADVDALLEAHPEWADAIAIR